MKQVYSIILFVSVLVIGCNGFKHKSDYGTDEKDKQRMNVAHRFVEYLEQDDTIAALNMVSTQFTPNSQVENQKAREKKLLTIDSAIAAIKKYGVADSSWEMHPGDGTTFFTAVYTDIEEKPAGRVLMSLSFFFNSSKSDVAIGEFSILHPTSID